MRQSDSDHDVLCDEDLAHATHDAFNVAWTRRMAGNGKCCIKSFAIHQIYLYIYLSLNFSFFFVSICYCE